MTIFSAEIRAQEGDRTSAETKPHIRLLENHQIPVIWDGRQVGVLTLRKDEELAVLREEDDVWICLRESQTLAIPKRITQQVPAHPAYQTTALPRPLTPPPETAENPQVREENPPNNSPSPSLSPAPPSAPLQDQNSLPDERLVTYLDQAFTLIRERPERVRILLYTRGRMSSPDPVRQILARELAKGTETEPVPYWLEQLKSAFQAYDRQQWSLFEQAIQLAQTNRPNQT